jgi:4-hydroxy-tetrahydrodipicolinate reductase
MSIALSILGACGKMGKRVLQLASQDPDFKLISGTKREETKNDDSTLPLFTSPLDALRGCDVAIDFTLGDSVFSHLDAALAMNKALVIGTTGHSEENFRAIEEASKSIPILFSPNFSFGVALCLEAVRRFAKALGKNCTIDIFERHHIHKKDRPSGTALAFAKATGKVIQLDETQVRKKEEVVIHSIREGEIFGEHLICFECGSERIEIKHTAHSRDAFAQGALLGAKFLAKQPPGLYSLKDLFP